MQELCRFIADEGARFPSSACVWQALRGRGKLLADEDGFNWGLLPLLVCASADGDPRQVFPLAVAVECFIAAADTFDDVQDDAADGLWRVYGRATTINVATFLLFLSQLALSRLTHCGVSCTTVAAVAEGFAAAGARACSGQQHDIDAACETDEATYLATIALKSGALVECACRAGALLGDTTPAAVESYAQFGLNAGIAMQIHNDIVGVLSESTNRGDLGSRKWTLPIIFARECAPEPWRGELQDILRSSQRPGAEEIDRLRHLLVTTGSLQYAAVVADLYWERALSCLMNAGCDAHSALLNLVIELQLQGTRPEIVREAIIHG